MMNKLQILYHINEEKLRPLRQLISPNFLKQSREFIRKPQLRLRVDQLLSVLLLLTFELLCIFLFRCCKSDFLLVGVIDESSENVLL